jgi:hypothetical protein
MRYQKSRIAANEKDMFYTIYKGAGTTSEKLAPFSKPNLHLSPAR